MCEIDQGSGCEKGIRCRSLRWSEFRHDDQKNSTRYNARFRSFSNQLQQPSVPRFHASSLAGHESFLRQQRSPSSKLHRDSAPSPGGKQKNIIAPCQLLRPRWPQNFAYMVSIELCIAVFARNTIILTPFCSAGLAIARSHVLVVSRRSLATDLAKALVDFSSVACARFMR